MKRTQTRQTVRQIQLRHRTKLCTLADAQCQQCQYVNQNRYILPSIAQSLRDKGAAVCEVHSTPLSYKHAEIKATNGKGFYGYVELFVPAISMTPPVNCSDLLCGVVCTPTFLFSYVMWKFRMKFLVSSSSKSFASLHQHKWLCDLRK